jgi:peptidoglycan/LPS O-acetylase OafA/YrhL
LVNLRSKHINYFPELNSLRAISVLMVVASHWSPIEIPYLWYGVQIFFGISGFLITSILIGAFDTEKKFTRVYVNFFIRRSLRIFPLYFLFVTFFFVIHEYFNLFTWRDDYALYFYTFIPNFLLSRIGLNNAGFYSHLWSLGVEEQFYFFYPFVLFLTYRRRFLLLLFLLVLFSLLVCSTASFFYVDVNVGVLPWANFHTLCAGALLAYINKFKPKWQEYLKLNKRVFLNFFMVLLCGYLAFKKTEEPISIFVQELLLTAVVFCCLNFTLNQSKGLSQPIFRSVMMQKIGVVSYGIYLFHMPMPSVIRAFASHFAVAPFNPWLELFLSCVSTYFLAWLSYKYFEMPFLSLKNKFQ